MKIMGFLQCDVAETYFLRNKIYPFYEISDNGGAYYVCDEENDIYPIQINDGFRIYHYPEFPEDINQWTDNDWFQYHLKYGE